MSGERVLVTGGTAARDAGAKRVVLTSSFAAIEYSPKTHEGGYTEVDWTDPSTPGITCPAWSSDLSTSVEMMRTMINGEVPVIPRSSVR